MLRFACFINVVAICCICVIALSCAPANKHNASGRDLACSVVTNAINHGDWSRLQALAGPLGRRSFRWTADAARRGITIRVGPLRRIEDRVDENGVAAKVYVFDLEGIPHQLEVETIRDNRGREKVADFWEFGW